MLIYREKPIRKWSGPLAVVDVYEKTVEVEIDGTSCKYSIDNVRRYTSELNTVVYPNTQEETELSCQDNNDANKSLQTTS